MLWCSLCYVLSQQLPELLQPRPAVFICEWYACMHLACKDNDKHVSERPALITVWFCGPVYLA